MDSRHCSICTALPLAHREAFENAATHKSEVGVSARDGMGSSPHLRVEVVAEEVVVAAHVCFVAGILPIVPLVGRRPLRV